MFSRILLSVQEGDGGEDLAVNGIGSGDADLALPCDELTCERIADMASLGCGVAGGGEAVTGRDVGRVVAEGEDGTVTEVDEGVGNTKGREKGAKAFEGVAFQDAREVEDNRPTSNPSL